MLKITEKQIANLEVFYKLSREDLAFIFDLSPSTIRAWEKGLRSPAKPYVIILRQMLLLYHNEYTRERALVVVDIAKSYAHQWGEDSLEYLMKNIFKLNEDLTNLKTEVEVKGWATR